jgi:hypothetical protein
VIDTGPAHSAAEEENDNREMHRLAMAIRELMHGLGEPALVALMHPAKAATRETLQPRGGGAFSGSIDGELCAWNEAGVVELFHRTKFRGPGFTPMFFRLERVALGVQDNFGANVATVVAVHDPEGRPAKSEGRKRGPWPAMILSKLAELSGLTGDSVAQSVLIAAVVAAMPKPEAGRDTRQQQAVRALREVAAEPDAPIRLHEGQVFAIGATV